MAKVRRHDVPALAIVFWLVSAGTFLMGLRTNPSVVAMIDPQITKLESLSSTTRFMLPLSPPWGPHEPVIATYTLTGAEITDSTPLTLEVRMLFSFMAKGNWVIVLAIAAPDTAISRVKTTVNGTERPTVTPAFVELRRSSKVLNDEIWTGNRTFELTAFGTLGVTVTMLLGPSEEMIRYMANTKNFSPHDAELFWTHTSTDILIESSRAVAAQKRAEQATQEGTSLTWFIIFFASLDIGFRVYDYRLYEKKHKRTRTNQKQA